MDHISKSVVFLSILIVLDMQCVLGFGRHNRIRVDKQQSVAASLASAAANDHNQDLVTNFPGQPDVSFRHYAGYVTVNEEHGRALFYWFYEALTQPQHKPLVLWLNGGPGCSSVGYGATQEIGPFIVDNKGRGLKSNPYAWNREANMLFLESPFGVGFSYTNTSGDYDNLGDQLTRDDAYAFLHNWFIKFPPYRGRAFYIAGESYAGKYIPELADHIYEKNHRDSSMYIDLKGILMGNPDISDADGWRGFVEYAWSHAVISDETHKIIRGSCNFDRIDTWRENKECSAAFYEVYRQYEEIDMYSLYTSVCISNSTQDGSSSTEQVLKMLRTKGEGYDPCLDDYAKAFYNRPDVQKALHVSDGIRLRNWSICNDSVFDDWSDTMHSVLPIYRKLISAGLRIWVYSGDTDGSVPVLSTRHSLNSLRLPILKAWRPWYHDKQVSGWYQEYAGVTFATFRGAGHAVPIFKPSSSLALFASFLQGYSLPSAREAT